MFMFFYLLGCYLVQPVKSNCLGRLRTRTETTTTMKRVAGLIPIDKESKLSTGRGIIKNGNHSQRIDAVECQL